MSADDTLYALRDVIRSRKAKPEENSYTCYLFEQGLDKILKKCGEECAETIIAAKNDSPEELAGEISDLLYHLLVLMEEKNLPLERVLEMLEARAQKIGNRKQLHQTDRES